MFGPLESCDIIFTDHHPLLFAVSDFNSNAKTKRWKPRIEESNARIFYKPGKEDLVADILSRHQLNVLSQQDSDSCIATAHSKHSLTYTIASTDKPLNYV